MALIITEGAPGPPADGQGYLLTPGIYTDAHIAGWRKVTDAVHAEGGRIIIPSCTPAVSPARTTLRTSARPSPLRPYSPRA